MHHETCRCFKTTNKKIYVKIRYPWYQSKANASMYRNAVFPFFSPLLVACISHTNKSITNNAFFLSPGKTDSTRQSCHDILYNVSILTAPLS